MEGTETQHALLCRFCRGDHELLECPEFMKMDSTLRRRYIIRHSHCLLCLRSRMNCRGHWTPETSIRCIFCNSNEHHSLMHSHESNPPRDPVVIDSVTVESNSEGVEPYHLQECPNCLEDHLVYNCSEWSLTPPLPDRASQLLPQLDSGILLLSTLGGRSTPVRRTRTMEISLLRVNRFQK